jgi:hypothetical protein
LIELAHRAGIAPDAPTGVIASAVDFVLEGMYSQKKISRSDERGYHGSEPAARRPQPPQSRTAVLTPDDDDDPEDGGRKKKRYYN